MENTNTPSKNNIAPITGDTVASANALYKHGICFLANGLMTALYDEEGGGMNMASFNPDGSFKGVMWERPAGAAPLPDLTPQEVIGALDIVTNKPRPITPFVMQLNRAARVEKDPLVKLRYYQIAHFAQIAEHDEFIDK